MSIKKHIGIILILLVAGLLRFYNLMHDAPYFFNPDERNMAAAITQFRLPNKLTDIPSCLYSEFSESHESRMINQESDCSLNPHFFAYGQFPLYLAYLSDQISQPFSHLVINTSANNIQPTANDQMLTTSFPSAIFWLRFWSALASTMTVLLVYKIVQLLFKSSIFKIGNYAALMAAFIPGLIQSAHFGTTESLLTFFFLCSLYFSLKLFRVNKSGMTREVNFKFLILNSICCGLAIGSKMTGAFFLVPPCLAVGFHFLIQNHESRIKNQGHNKLNLKFMIRETIFQAFAHIRILVFFFITTAFFTVISSPYNLVEPDHFMSAVFGYEADVARGKYEAFYTRQFVSTTPILFQFEKIFPYSLGIVLTVGGTIGLLVTMCSIILKIITILRKRIKNHESRIKKYELKSYFFLDSYFLILTSFFIYLVPNAFLFAKWSRFMTPILPFFVIFTIFLLYEINRRLNSFKLFFDVIVYALFIVHCAFGLAFFSIYVREDSRFQASEWIYKNIPSNAYILSETGNVVDIPIPPPTYDVQPTAYDPYPISFDFYHLDENPELPTSLVALLQKADYIFIPSRRIFANYMRIPDRYPILNKYYENLFNGNLGFEKVAEITSYPSWCLLPSAYCLLPDEQAEETYTVFDHPTIRIYKKNQSKTPAEYKKLLNIESRN